MTASRYCCASIHPSTTPWPNGLLMTSAASMPTSNCCCDEPSTMPGECRRRLERCPSGADHPQIEPPHPFRIRFDLFDHTEACQPDWLGVPERGDLGPSSDGALESGDAPRQ